MFTCVVKKMKLDNFNLEKIDLYNINHIKIIDCLNDDVYVKKYIGNLYRIINKCNESTIDSFYMVIKNEEIIGFIMLSFNNTYRISYALLPKYRKQYLAPLLLQEFSYHLLDNNLLINTLELIIESSNKKSINAANMVGYKKVSDYIYTLKK